MTIDYANPKWYPDAGDATSISNGDIELAVEECLLNGRCDINIFLKSSAHAERDDVTKEEIQRFANQFMCSECIAEYREVTSRWPNAGEDGGAEL